MSAPFPPVAPVHEEIVARGTRLYVPRGTPVTHRGQTVDSKRGQWVTVHHTLGPSQAFVGHLAGPLFTYYGHLVGRNAAEPQRAYHDLLECASTLDDLQEVGEGRLRCKPSRHDTWDIYVQLSEPQIVWAGSGGYWSSCLYANTQTQVL